MAQNKGHSEAKEDLFGKEYIQHYDESGRKCGTSWEKEDIWGKPYIQHEDERGKITGHTEFKKDWLGDPYLSRSDKLWKKTGESFKAKDFWGDEYTNNTDREGKTISQDRVRKDFWGDEYVEREHKGRKSDTRSAFTFGKKVGSYTSNLIGGSNTNDAETDLMVSAVIYMGALVIIGGIVIVLLYVAAVALFIGLILSPLIFGGLYLFKGKKKKWLWWIGGASLLLCLDFYIFGLSDMVGGNGSFMLLKLAYTGILATVIFILLEPFLSRKYPYNEEGEFFDQEQNRKRSLAGGFALLTLILFLSTSWSTLFPPSDVQYTSNPTPTSSESPTPTPPSSSLNPQEPISSLMTAKVNGLRVRKAPFSNTEVLDGLEEGEQATYLGEKSDFTFTATLRDQETTDYWYKVRTSRGIEGWVFGGGLQKGNDISPVSTDILKGNWTGKLGEKGLSLFISQIENGQISGSNQVGDNKRTVSGALQKIDLKTYSAVLHEPGDHTWDGVFTLTFKEINGVWEGRGSWKSNNGKLNREVSLER